MFTPLVQGKESRIVDENHLVLPGRFRAHAGAPARSGPTSSTHGNEHAESSSNQRPGFAQAASSYRTAFPSYNATGAGARAAGARGGGPQAVGPSKKYEGAQLNARRGGTGSSSNPVTPTRRTNRRLSSQRAPGSAGAGGGGGALSERAWLLRPTRDRVETWLDAWYKRWLVLVIVPSCIVWIWCAVPFPVSDPYDPTLPWPEPGWNWSIPAHSILVHDLSFNTAPASLKTPPLSGGHGQPSTTLQDPSLNAHEAGSANSTFEAVLHSTDSSTSVPAQRAPQRPSSTPSQSPRPELPSDLPVDINFWFFILYYYGAYLAVALIWVTCLFNLYRLNWWPRKLGGTTSYLFFWTGALVVGTIIHYFDVFGIQRHRKQRTGKTYAGDNVDWERKTFWVGLAFGTMAMPALVCFAKLRRDRRMTYRHSLTEHQKTFLEVQLGVHRMPKSYIRFLWFMSCIAIALFAGLAGQAYMSVYLSTLPHGSVESVVYVWTWVLSCALFGIVISWILERKVGSRALDFVFRLYFQLVYHVFYRTLFARLRKAEQFLYLQVLSSAWIIAFYPIYMSRTSYRVIKWLGGYDKSYEQHADAIATTLYVRNLSENVTMVAFLGWLTILHFGPNREVYPFFDFSPSDPYNYRRTAISSLIIWFFELLSSFCARHICWFAFRVDVTNTGLDTLREYPELLPACVWASVHVCMDILLYLVKYNFR